MSTDNSNNSTNTNKVPVIIYSGVAPGLYGIEVDCVPEHDYHVYLDKSTLERMLGILEQHSNLMDELDKLHMTQLLPSASDF